MNNIFYPYPSIEQFRKVDAIIKKYYSKLEKITYCAYPKLHGTNATIVINKDKSIYFQSRNQIITKEHYGFVDAFQENETLDSIVHIIYKEWLEDDIAERVILYGEWCGKGIQQKAAISELKQKTFFVFDIALIINGVKNWLLPREKVHYLFYEKIHKKQKGKSIINFCLMDKKIYIPLELEVDFNEPEIYINKMVEKTLEIENECPISKLFKIKGIGEGIVWKPNYPYGDIRNNSRLWFKTKGEKHTETKVKKLIEVDIEKVKKVKEFVEICVTESRLLKGIDYLKEMNLEIDISSTGRFLSWIFQDCLKEEGDRLEDLELNKKDISKEIGKKSRNWYLKHIGEK